MEIWASIFYLYIKVPNSDKITNNTFVEIRTLRFTSKTQFEEVRIGKMICVFLNH